MYLFIEDFCATDVWCHLLSKEFLIVLFALLQIWMNALTSLYIKIRSSVWQPLDVSDIRRSLNPDVIIWIIDSFYTELITVDVFSCSNCTELKVWPQISCSFLIEWFINTVNMLRFDRCFCSVYLQDYSLLLLIIIVSHSSAKVLPLFLNDCSCSSLCSSV